MDLTGKGYSPAAHSFLQNASSLVSAYGLGSSMVAAAGGQTPLTTSLFGASHSLASPVYSGSLGTSLSPSHVSYSNGHNISSNNRQLEKHSDGSSKAQLYASPAPVFNRHKDSFPYGLSGVPMPNYGYHSDVYQFTSNGYPRKSRTCSYCGKVFTRSTTRRYHEKRCPLLRAAVSSYMGEENSGAGPGASSQPRATRAGEITTHSYKAQGQALGPSISGNFRSNDPQELATSMLVKSPSGDRRASGDSMLSGYQTSVIVKQEPHELEAMANMAGATSNMSLSHKSCVQSQEHLSDSVLRFSPESNDSANKLDSNVSLSPGYHAGIDLSKSPSHTSQRDDTSMINEDYIREKYNKLVSEERGGEMMNHDGRKMSALSSQELLALQQARYGMAEKEAGLEPGENNHEDMDMDTRAVDENHDNKGSYSDVESGEIVLDGESESITSDKREGKIMGSHKCGICGKNFESAGKLHLHEQLHTKFKPYACKFCGQKFSKSAQRMEHEKSHNGLEAVHVCAVCGSSFTRKYSLKLHMHRWHQEGPWLCRHCGKASLTQMELKTHLYSHNLPRSERESLLYMPDVPLNYSGGASGSGADSPMKNGNIDPKDLDPGGGGSAVATVNPAMEQLPSGQEMEMCQECGRDFPKGYMRYHLKSHEAQKPYSCPICAKRFGYKNNMKSHIKLHTGIKPFQCKMCGAKFTRGSTLRRHARRHGIIADSVWDLFIKPDYSKSGSGAGAQSHSTKLDTISTSKSDTNVTATNQTSTSSGGANGDSSNYLASSVSPSASHGSLYPLYASLGQIPPVAGLYPGLSATTSYLAQHLPHSSVYAASASSHLHPQQLDALNLSLNKTPTDQQSDQSSFSNVSMERSRSRSRSLSGSEPRRYPLPEPRLKVRTVDVSVQVCTCCPLKLKEQPPHLPPRRDSKEELPPDSLGDEPPPGPGAELDPPGQASTPPSLPGATNLPTTPGSHVPNTPSPLAVVPYIVTSPSQRPSNLDSTSPASVSSGKDISLETISTLIGSGRMFKCFHCECYFSEYAMYRIHAKLHSSDFTRPFLCLICGEDCHDRVYFALHLSEHLH